MHGWKQAAVFLGTVAISVTLTVLINVDSEPLRGGEEGVIRDSSEIQQESGRHHIWEDSEADDSFSGQIGSKHLIGSQADSLDADGLDFDAGTKTSARERFPILNRRLAARNDGTTEHVLETPTNLAATPIDPNDHGLREPRRLTETPQMQANKPTHVPGIERARPIRLAHASSTGGASSLSSDAGNSLSRAPIITDMRDANIAATIRDYGVTSKTHFAVDVQVYQDNARGTIIVRARSSQGSGHDTPLRIEGNPDRPKRTVTVDLSTLANQGEIQIVAVWKPDDGLESRASEPRTVTIDTQGPVVESVELVGVVGDDNPILEVRFRDDDLNENSVKEKKNYIFSRTKGKSYFGKAEIVPKTVDLDGRIARLTLPPLETDTYRLTINHLRLENEANASNNASDTPATGSESGGEVAQSPTNTKNTDTPIQDSHGNFAPAKQVFEFGSYPRRERGEHVEFSEYIPRRKRPRDVEFNPGDHVETRVARLYYFRDAHRVAEIINRRVRSYNRAAVDQREREAERSRERADELTDERRVRERAAVRAVQETRRLERELRDLPDEIRNAEEEAERLRVIHERAKAAEAALKVQEADKKRIEGSLQTAASTAVADKQKLEDDAKRLANEEQAALSAMNTNLASNATQPQKDDARKTYQDAKTRRDAADKKLADAMEAIRRHDVAKDDLADAAKALAVATQRSADASGEYNEARNELRRLERRERELQRELQDQRDRELQRTEETDQSQDKEDRAREDQFRKEVAAATEDPDTYVPGKMESVDPVTQVSISVIGEGLIHLRGPIRGINKIRTMIDQIDSPVGQVKVGIFTVQVNGEHGDRMEKVFTRIEGNVDLSRFLSMQSLLLLRRAIQEVAGEVAWQVEQVNPGHYQQDRDRKYMYAFFGRDFIDELYAMDSELLNSRNKLLSIHAMDTVSRSKALFILALAKNDVRQAILDRFMELVYVELPQAEYDFRRSSGLLPRCFSPHKNICERARENYKFRSLRGFFNAHVHGADVMTPMQREFIRLAQIFKSQMIAEMELKQRVIERALIEDRANDEDRRFNALVHSHERSFGVLKDTFSKLVNSEVALRGLMEQLVNLVSKISTSSAELAEAQTVLRGVAARLPSLVQRFTELKEQRANPDRVLPVVTELQEEVQRGLHALRVVARDEAPVNVKQRLVVEEEDLASAIRVLQRIQDALRGSEQTTTPQIVFGLAEDIQSALRKAISMAQVGVSHAEDAVRFLDSDARTIGRIYVELEKVLNAAQDESHGIDDVASEFDELVKIVESMNHVKKAEIIGHIQQIFGAIVRRRQFPNMLTRSERLLDLTRQRLDHRKLLDFMIDEQEEKHIELREGTRSHIAAIDHYLKRLTIAIEDDLKVQFYDPAFREVRGAGREWDVNLGQIERTTILTNNRAFAKVDPQATMEFDLPKRKILIQEAMQGAQALMQDYGALLQDPTFLAATSLLSGSPPSSTFSPPQTRISGLPGQGLAPPSVRNVTTGLPSSTEEAILTQQGGQRPALGSNLEALIPDPAIYKFETGTGFEIRPVIQPDGDSVIFDFDYMYSTNVREPVRADEKHLGRIKRQPVHTQVQISSFELREVSRYQVALKASRTSRGVPLLEDIPVAGVLFRPLPSAESALQENIILAQSTVYPTLFDLMGLRWAPQIADVDHESLRDEEHVIRGRRTTIRDWVFDESSRRVDEFLKLPRTKAHRPDLYRRQRRPSRYHPSGYTAPHVHDPTGHDFKMPDRRPIEMRDPPYDSRRRNPVPAEMLPSDEPLSRDSSRAPGRPEINFDSDSSGNYRPRTGVAAQAQSRSDLRQFDDVRLAGHEASATQSMHNNLAGIYRSASHHNVDPIVQVPVKDTGPSPSSRAVRNVEHNHPDGSAEDSRQHSTHSSYNPTSSNHGRKAKRSRFARILRLLGKESTP